MEHKLAQKDLEILRLREALKDANELIAIEPFEHVAEEAADAHYAIRQALSTPTTYDDLMAYVDAQLGEPVAYYQPCFKAEYDGYKDICTLEELNLGDSSSDYNREIQRKWLAGTPLYAKKG